MRQKAKELLLYYKKFLEERLKKSKKFFFDFLKGEKEIKIKPPSEVPSAIRILIPFLIFFQAAYPSIGIFILILIFGGSFMVSLVLPNLSRSLVILGMILLIFILLPNLCNLFTGRTSPAYYETISKLRTVQLPPIIISKFVIFPGALIKSEILALSIVAIGSIVFPAIGSKIKSLGGFVFYNLFLMFFLYYLPILIFTSSSFAQYLFPWEIRSYLEKKLIEEIPERGGITIKFGSGEIITPPKLIAGSPYYYTFTISNNYEKNVSITLNPFLEIIYKGQYIRFFTNSTHLTIPSAENESYPIPISLIFDPYQIEINTSPCPYSESILRSYWGLSPEEEVECASDISCPEGKYCAELTYFICECIDWNTVSCNGDMARIGVLYTHTGFLKGKATLYYGEEYKEVPNQKFVQGPLTVYATFFPNPWIEKYYKGYQDKVILMLEAEGSGEISINNITVNSTKVSVITEVEGYSKELKKPVKFIMVEEVSLKLRNCSYLPEKNPKISGKGRMLIYMCEFDPLSIDITVKEMKVLKESYTTKINYAELDKYCSYGFETELMKSFKNKKVARELASILGKSPLCKAKEGKGGIKGITKEEVRKLIESTLRRIDVGFKINYKRSYTEYSSWTNIDKNVPVCLEMIKS